MKLQQLMGIAFGLCLSGTLYTSAQTQLTDYVDPRIGSEGLGRVFIGPSCPYGMVKPSRPIVLLHPIAAGYPCPNG